MHDLVIVLLFLSMILAPCVVALNTGVHNKVEVDDPM
jgi:hypothetical protein